MLSEFAPTEATAETSASVGGGLSGLFLVGVAGIVLGVLALIGVYPQILTAAATIAFDGAVVVSAAAVWHRLISRSVAARFLARGSMLSFVASDVAAGSSGIQAMAGLASGSAFLRHRVPRPWPSRAWRCWCRAHPF